MKDVLRGPRKRVVWEVFVDQGPLSVALPEYPQVDVIQFRLEDGWDFSKPAIIRTFLAKLGAEKPGGVFWAPPFWRCQERDP